MEKQSNIILKIMDKDMFSFYNSEDKLEFTMGAKGNDINIRSNIVAEKNVRFYYEEKNWYIADISGYGNVKVGLSKVATKTKIKEQDVITIFHYTDKKNKATLKIEVMKQIDDHFNSEKTTTIDLTSRTEFVIGRDESCAIRVNNPLVGSQHCRIIYDVQTETFFLEDMKSISGTFINNKKTKRAQLRNYDRISLAGISYIFYKGKLLFSKAVNGVEIKVQNVTKTVDNKGVGTITLVDDVTFTINAGELVAVVGGSGAGKSTLVDCINGSRPCTSGKILYDDNDYYENINSYRGVVGNVPQRDIMHDDLTVEKGLYYTAKIRMRSDLTKPEIVELVRDAIDSVKLNGKEKLKISALSGGQKKRVSIAMELLADPKIIFLDEPTSGLSPDLDLEMMELLRELAIKGRTIVIITHAMDNIDKCDKVAFLGKGGRLCYYDKPEGLLPYFGAKNYGELFKKLTNEAVAIAFSNKLRVKAVETLAQENK